MKEKTLQFEINDIDGTEFCDLADAAYVEWTCLGDNGDGIDTYEVVIPDDVDDPLEWLQARIGDLVASIKVLV